MDNTQAVLPEWALSIRANYKAGRAHVFGLHSGVSDYVVPGVRLPSYLAGMFARRDVIAFYDRAAGITFASAEQEKRFRQMSGFDDQAAVDPVLAALGGAAGGAGDRPLPTDPAAALALLETAMRNSGEGSQAANPDGYTLAVIIGHAETITPDASKGQMSPEDRTNLVRLVKWGSDPAIERAGAIVILLTDSLSEVHADLKAAPAKIEWGEIPLPTYEDRLDMIEWLIERDRQQAVDEKRQPLGLEMAPAALAAQTASLGRLHVEDIFLRAAADGGVVTSSLVTERKGTLMRQEYEDVLSEVQPVYGYEGIGGLAHVKTYFADWVIEPLRKGYSDMVPLGCLLTGAAGTGKTAMAQAVAKESGLACVTLAADQIMGSYVGESERKLAKALRGIQALAPCLVFVDEIDQRFRRQEGGSGGGDRVGGNQFSKLLEFLGDESHRGRIVWLAATNRPDLLDAAFRRAGRFDAKIPFFPPDSSERAEIIRALGKRNGLDLAGADLSGLVQATEGYTGAEIGRACVKARGLARLRQIGPVQALAEAFRTLRASTKDIEYMTALALAECDDMDLVPERYQARLKDASKLQAEIKALRPDEPAGRGARRDL